MKKETNDNRGYKIRGPMVTGVFTVRNIIVLAMVALCCCSTVKAGWAAIYYIDQTRGADNQKGNLDTPWKTLSKLSFSSIRPGDTISLKRGEVWEENLIIYFSGTQAAPITINAHGSGAQPRVKGFVYICGSDIRIENIDAVQSDVSGFIVDTSCASRISISQCVISDHAFSGITLTGGTGTDFSIRDNDIQNNPLGIVSFNSGSEQFPTRIVNNNFTSNGNIGILIQGEFHELINNKFSGSSQIGVLIDLNSRNTAVTDNVFQGNSVAGVWISGTADSGHAVTENRLTGNTIGVYLENDNRQGEETAVTDNVIQNHTAIGIYAQGSGYLLDSNTIADSGEAGIYIASECTGISMMNNDISGHTYGGIVMSKGSGPGLYVAGNVVHDNAGHGIASLADAEEGNETIIADNDAYGNGYDGILLQGDYHVVEHNRVRDNGAQTWSLSWGATGIHVYAENPQEQVEHNLIRYNTVSGTRGNSQGSDGNGILVDEWCRGNICHHNVTVENQGPGFGVFGGNENAFYNNIAYNNSTDARPYLSRMEVLVASNADPVPRDNVFQNNIILAVDATVIPVIVDWNAYNRRNLFGYNIIRNTQGGDLFYWNDNVGSSIAQWNLLAEEGGDDFNSSPEFLDAEAENFMITSTSSAIDRGTDIALPADFDGNPIPSNGIPDIGIMEYQSIP